MLKSYKYRIYPTPEQRSKIDHSIGCCRLVYNLALEVKIAAYKGAGVKMSAFDLCYQLNDLKSAYPWLKEVDSQSLQAAVKKVDISFKNFFKGSGYPKFKSKKGVQSYQSPHPDGKKINFKSGELSVMKLPKIPIRISRTFLGKMKTITISKTSTGKYFASILVDDGYLLPDKKGISKESIVGIDVGIKSFAILSSGEKIPNPKYYHNSIKRLVCLQRRVSKKNNGSENRKKSIKKVSLHHEKISNKRKDFLHKLSTAITKQYDTIVGENLNVVGMVKNRKLSRSISDTGWGEFYRQIGYKSVWNGNNFLQVPRFYPSSKLCSYCGTKNEKLKLSDREWQCATCGKSHDRDENASRNIEQYFLTNSPMGSRGEPVELSVLAGAVKQELMPSK